MIADPRMFQIVPLAPGEKPAPGAIAHGGGLDLILAHLSGRSELDTAIAKATAAEARAEAAIRDHNKALSAIVDEMSGRVGDFEGRILGLRKSAAECRDLDAETSNLQRYAIPPDEPAVAADDPVEETHGELTIHPPSHPRDKAMLHPDTVTGATPGELERNAPTLGGPATEPVLDPAELGRPTTPKYRVPAAASLT
jgi:hypothetical protein